MGVFPYYFPVVIGRTSRSWKHGIKQRTKGLTEMGSFSKWGQVSVFLEGRCLMYSPGTGNGHVHVCGHENLFLKALKAKGRNTFWSYPGGNRRNNMNWSVWKGPAGTHMERRLDIRKNKLAARRQEVRSFSYGEAECLWLLNAGC